MRWLHTIVLGALCLSTLVGCGFQLRSYSFATDVTRVALVGRTQADVVPVLRNLIAQAGVAEVSADQAQVVLELLEERRERRSVSTTGGARAAEYETSLAVQYRVLDNAGQELAPVTWIERQRVYRIDRDNIMASSGEQVLLEAEMRDDIAAQLVRVLDAVSRRMDASMADTPTPDAG